MSQGKLKIRCASPTVAQESRAILEVHRKAVHGTATPFYSKEIIAE
jgi:hypothetical protein